MIVPSFIKTNVPLASYSTLGVGGSAAYLAVIGDKTGSGRAYVIEKELLTVWEFVRDNNLEFFVLGCGSNILFSDKGFNGVVLHMHLEGMDGIEFVNNKIWVSAGTAVVDLVRFGKTYGFTGFEFLAGLPGTIGGAICGNAGCYGGEFWDVVEEVNFFDGEYVQTKRKNNSMFGYRQSIFKQNPNWIILSARLITRAFGKRTVASRTRVIMSKRTENQPMTRSAGCIFKNPTIRGGVVSAGRLIDLSGLKGSQVGGAKISSKHGNFFINSGCAKANDFVKLTEVVKGEVLKKFGVLLKEEIVRVGEF